MLELLIHGEEFFNEETNEFIETEETILQLEHSLLSVSKWESLFGKAFLSQKEKSNEEVLAYIKCMVIGEKPPEEIFHRLSQKNVEAIRDYIESPQSATVFRDTGPPRKKSNETITSELIYYWMVALQIPFECETWHLNRLFTLIRVCNLKNSNGKTSSMSKSEIAARNRELNAQRRAELGTKG